MAYRNNNSFHSGKIPFELANKKLFINGDDINVHCKGTKIYIWKYSYFNSKLYKPLFEWFSYETIATILIN